MGIRNNDGLFIGVPSINIDPSGKLFYLDEMTNDFPPKNIGPAVYLLAHNQKITYGNQLEFVKSSFNKKNNLAINVIKKKTKNSWYPPKTNGSKIK